MKRASLALTLAVALAGCATLAPGSAGTEDQLRADLRDCLTEILPFTLIPDFGITATEHRIKCMRERGWIAGTGMRDYKTYSRIYTGSVAPPVQDGPPVPVNTACAPGTVKDGQGCRYIAAPVEPAWDTGE